MALERKLAEENNYEDPVNTSQEATAKCYDICSKYYLEHKCPDSYM